MWSSKSQGSKEDMFAIPVSLFKVSIWDKLNRRHPPLRLCYYAPVLNYAEHEGVKWWPEKNAFICSRETLCLQKAFAGETHLIPESAPVSILCGLDGVLEISIHLLYRLNEKKRKNEIKKDYSLHSLCVPKHNTNHSKNRVLHARKVHFIWERTI